MNRLTLAQRTGAASVDARSYSNVMRQRRLVPRPTAGPARKTATWASRTSLHVRKKCYGVDNALLPTLCRNRHVHFQSDGDVCCAMGIGAAWCARVRHLGPRRVAYNSADLDFVRYTVGAVHSCCHAQRFGNGVLLDQRRLRRSERRGDGRSRAVTSFAGRHFTATAPSFSARGDKGDRPACLAGAASVCVSTPLIIHTHARRPWSLAQPITSRSISIMLMSEPVMLLRGWVNQ